MVTDMRNRQMQDVSTFRLYLLRAVYLLIAIGMGMQIWPLILGGGSAEVEHMRGVVRAMLGALTLLCLLGVRYPLPMLPLLLFELTWKTIWVIAIGVPLWRGGRLSAAAAETWTATIVGIVLVVIAIPWGYVFHHYVKQPGARWTRTHEGRATA